MKENGKRRGRVQFNRRTLVLPRQNTHLYTGDGIVFFLKEKKEDLYFLFSLGFSPPARPLKDS